MTIKTTLEVEAKPKGFAQLRTESGGLNKEILQGQQSQKRGFDELSRKTKSFGDTMAKTMQAVGDNRRAVQGLRDIGRHFDQLDQKVSKLEASLKKASAAQGAFSQGLSQGLGAGEFLQRGPGMGRQVAGRTLGRLARGGPAMFGGGMMQGAQGVVGAMGSMPGGQLVAGPLGAAVGFAGRALQFQRQRLGAASTLGGFGLSQQMMRARGPMESLSDIQSGAEEARSAAEMAPMRQTARQFRQKLKLQMESSLQGGRFGNIGANIEATSAMADVSLRGEEAASGSVRGEAAYANERRRRMGARQAALQRGRGTRDAFFGSIQQAGRGLGGLTREQSEQFAAQLGQAGGTTDPRSMLRTGIAAQTAFGVGADVSGAFLSASRRGGVSGGPAGAEGLTSALSGAMQAGLEGSEITNYMRETAEGIRRFNQTGIPINPTSVAGMARAVSTLGLGATRGSRVAQGIFSAGQRVSQTGPTGALDLLMLQQSGFQGGGMQDLLDSMMSLEETGVGAAGSKQLIKTLAQAGGGGAGGVLAVHRGLGQMGANVGLREAQILTKQALGKDLSPEENKRLKTIHQQQDRAARGAPTSPEALQNLARTMTTSFGPNLERQAKIQDAQLAQGQALLPAVENLQVASTKMATAVTDTLAPQMTLLSDAVLSATDQISEILRLFREKGVAEALGLKGT